MLSLFWSAAAVFAAMITLAAAPVRAEVVEKSTEILGSTVHYKVILPNNYDPAKSYPAILGFGGGAQDMRSVDGVITRNFKDEAEKRGYIVVMPAAPDGDQFFNGGGFVPRFIKLILSQYKIQDNKFHAAGPSNGGISSFHIASLFPEYFLSITAFPGYLWEETPQHISDISEKCASHHGLCVHGELDPIRMAAQDAKAQTQIFKDRGITAEYIIRRARPRALLHSGGDNARYAL